MACALKRIQIAFLLLVALPAVVLADGQDTQRPNYARSGLACVHGKTSRLLEALRSLLPETVVTLKNEEYVIGDGLGEGGYGLVAIAQKKSTQRYFAIKKILNEEDADMFRQEFDMMVHAQKRTKNPSRFPNANEFGMSNHGTVLVFELIPGSVDLAKLIEEGKLSEREILEIILEVARGLADLHQAGILHRDIKPSNIFVAPNRTVLGDFGLALFKSESEAENIANGNRVLGTSFYISPRRWKGKAATPQDDLWSLGVTAYEALNRGTPPFDGFIESKVIKETLKYGRGERNLNPIKGVSAETQQLIRKLLPRDHEVPSLKSAKQVVRELEKLLGH